LRRLAALPADERHVLARAFGLIVWYVVALRVFPFGVVARSIRRGAGLKTGSSKTGPSTTDSQRIAALVDAAGGVLRASCLPRALALSRILRSRGVAHEVRIGVRNRPGFEAHAWVVEGDRVLIGRADVESYVPLTTLPRAST
jgi:hypothetical protein